jgi:hypothetical protein
LPYEPQDLNLSLNKNAYRDYRAKRQATTSTDQKQHPDTSQTEPRDEKLTLSTPDIEFVCRRLTVKFEPIFNIVHRYMLCRCVMWRGTPSNIIPEMTFLRDAICPRHNTTGATFRDYGDHDLPCHEDPYFERFGGYNVFWALLDRQFHKIFEELNGSAQMSKFDLVQGHIAYFQNLEERPQWPQDVAEDYWFDILDYFRATYKKLPPDLEKNYLRIQKKRVERGIDKTHNREEVEDDQIEQQRREFSESVMGKELSEISSGRWNGKPHWKLGK